MASAWLSARARADLVSVGEYTLRIWGQAQTIRYIDRLENCMEQLARTPMLGRPCDDILPGLRRFEEGRHVIFYRLKKNGILVSRILHQKMLPQRKVQ